MTRLASRTLQALLDIGALAAVLVVAYLLRFEGRIPPYEVQRIWIVLPYFVAVEYGTLLAFAVPRFAWRYVGLREVTTIFYAMAAATALLVTTRYTAEALIRTIPGATHAIIPTGVLLINFVIGFCAIAGLRVLRRLSAERAGKLAHAPATGSVAADRKRTILIGAGQAGVMVAKEIEGHPDMGIQAVAFLDDDPVKRGTIVQGLPVLGTTEQLKVVAEDRGAQQVLITIAGARGRDIRRILSACEEAGLPVKIVPGIHEIVGGHVNLSLVRNVAIEDLLRREPVELDKEAIAAAIEGHAVLVTGAGGSIGSEICRQVCGFRPERLVLVEQAENALFEIHTELSSRFPQVPLVPVIADVVDERRIGAVLSRERPTMIFHAAAHKHVPMMEWNPGEAVKNNVLGTKTVADLADRFGVGTFVFVSTDKAVNPSSMMGASKRIAEIYTQALSSESRTRFLTVRFGNVLGSAGSVVPVFKRQIAAGGPVTVTHPDMQRYFMTIPEASQLVLQAATMGEGGEIFILDMGEPVRIVQLAEDLISLSGLRPNEDIEIRFTGVRPGEKLFEELSVAGENADKTRHPKIFVGRLKAARLSEAAQEIERLREACEGGDEEAVRLAVIHAVPEFQREEQVAAISGPVQSAANAVRAERPSRPVALAVAGSSS